MRKIAGIAALALLASTPALAQNKPGVTYEVTITNLTPGQTFTPILAATHRSSISFFAATWIDDRSSPEIKCRLPMFSVLA